MKYFLNNVLPVLIVFTVVLCLLVGFELWSLDMHKSAMERIAGHKITYWDAYWTK